MIKIIGHQYDRTVTKLISLVTPGQRTITYYQNYSIKYRSLQFPPCISVLSTFADDKQKQYYLFSFFLFGIKEFNQDPPLVYPLPLPNHYRHGLVCLGDITLVAPTITQLNHQAIDHYLHSTFTKYEDHFELNGTTLKSLHELPHDFIAQYAQSHPGVPLTNFVQPDNLKPL